MHNPVGPWSEANALYIEQSQLDRRLKENVARELVVFDVGLGAAANALATLHCARREGRARPLRLVSFERDLELLRFALHHAAKFAHFQGFEVALEAILARGWWREDGIHWELRHGDFLARIAHEPQRADLIFFDPYSPTVNLEMWTIEAFRKLRERCVADPDGGTMLYTYSRATPVRVALLYAGFFVGAGRATGLKDETTQAATLLPSLPQPLGEAWLKRWERSHTPNAFGAHQDEFAAIQRAVLAHPQFRP